MGTATRTFSPRPFLKWPGGKWELAEQIVPLLPDPATVRVYREPFCGAAGLAFRYAVPAGLAVALSDTEGALIDTFAEVVADVEGLIAAATALCLPLDPERPATGAAKHEAHFYRLRERYNAAGAGLSRQDRAALFLYLHRAGFNGLHRVDSRGRFNTSYGDLTGPPPLHPDKLRVASAALRALPSASFERLDFEVAALRAGPGDVVYLDPPYDGTWVGYQAGGFGSTAGSDACQVDLFTRQAERPALLRLRVVA